MTKTSKPITPDSVEVVDKQIAADFGIVRFVEPLQISLIGLALSGPLFAVVYNGDIKPTAISICVSIAICVGMGGVAAALIPFARSFRKQSRRAYSDIFERYEFVTPAGEEVTFVSTNHTGTHIDVRFSDGHQVNYPLYELSNKAGELHDWARFKHTRSDYLKHLSKVKWRTPGGKTGIVRDVLRYEKKDTELLLKLEDGEINSFPLGTLEPLPESSRNLVKSETAAS